MRPDQERVRNLLIDTVTLLCKNSVQFKDELHVEGLLGVSVDKKEVFFVHISKEFTNSPSGGATVTQDATDSQDDESRLPDDSVDGRDSHQQKLSDRVREEQARIKTEIVDVEQECLIVEDPNIKLEGLVSPAQIIAGQRRAVKRTSHGGMVAGDSGQPGDQYHDDGMGAGGYGSEDISVDNSHYGQTGEPLVKRKADRNSDGGYNMTHGDEDPGGTPWPSIASVPGFDPSQQSFQQDSDNSQMSMTDGTQPGCSTWSTPGRGPSDSENRPLSLTPRYKFECTICGHSSPAQSKLDSHMLSHTGVKPFSCSTCDRSFNRKDNLKRHLSKCPGLKAAISLVGTEFYGMIERGLEEGQEMRHRLTDGIREGQELATMMMGKEEGAQGFKESGRMGSGEEEGAQGMKEGTQQGQDLVLIEEGAQDFEEGIRRSQELAMMIANEEGAQGMSGEIRHDQNMGMMITSEDGGQ